MKQIKKIKSIVVRGKRYKFSLKKNLIENKQARGLTDHPDTKNKEVVIDPNQTQKELLATLLDELIHCAIFEIDNSVVDEISDDMANVLWRCGLRFVEDPKSFDNSPETK